MRVPYVRRRRAGLSELVATMLTLTLTLVAGSAVFYYVSARSVESVSLYGESVSGVISFLQERATIVDLNYTSNSVTIWIYNSGKADLEIIQILIYDYSRSLYYLYNASHVIDLNNPTNPVWLDTNPALEKPRLSSFKLSPERAATITLTIPDGWINFVRGQTYYVSITAKHGNVFTYYQRW
jgi:hypothetical protein